MLMIVQNMHDDWIRHYVRPRIVARLDRLHRDTPNRNSGGMFPLSPVKTRFSSSRPESFAGEPMSGREMPLSPNRGRAPPDSPSAGRGRQRAASVALETPFAALQVSDRGHLTADGSPCADSAVAGLPDDDEVGERRPMSAIGSRKSEGAVHARVLGERVYQRSPGGNRMTEYQVETPRWMTKRAVKKNFPKALREWLDTS